MRASGTAPASRSAYQQLFPTRQIDKFYEAIAPALPGLTFPLVHKSRLVEGEPFFRMQEGAGAANTETAVEVREKNGDLWRYGLFPVTGKKHQLRVHMTALGASICNDPFYPDVIKDDVDDYANPLKLLAQGVRFIDPPSFQKGSFLLTKDYQRVLRRLPDLLTPQGTVLACMNDPAFGEDFLIDGVTREAPGLRFVERLQNPPEFPDIDPQSGLKALVFRQG